MLQKYIIFDNKSSKFTVKNILLVYFAKFNKLNKTFIYIFLAIYVKNITFAPK